jgi:hypothetical protein
MAGGVLRTRKIRRYRTGETGLRRWFREGSTHGGGKCLAVQTWARKQSGVSVPFKAAVASTGPNPWHPERGGLR